MKTISNVAIGVTIGCLIAITQSCIYISQSNQGGGCTDGEIKIGKIIKAGSKKCEPSSSSTP